MIRKALAIALCAILSATTAAAQYALARAVDVNPDPKVFETTIVAFESQIDVDGNGLMASMYTFNGTVPGPEFRVKVGDKVIVKFINLLPLPSSIHWHGIEVNNASDGTPVTQNEVMPGGQYTYEFVLVRPGVFWYHPHMAPTNQVFKGMYASFIVTDEHDDELANVLGVLPGKNDTHTLVLSDVTVAKPVGQNDAMTFPADPSLPWAGGSTFPGNPFPPSPLQLCETAPMDDMGNPTGSGPLAPGTVPNVQQARNCAPCRTNEGQLVLANGSVAAGRAGSPDAPGVLDPGAETLDVLAGQGLRLRVINTAVTRYFRLRATDESGQIVYLYRVGGEGGLLDRARLEGGMQGSLDTKFETGEIVLGPSQRADLVLAVPSGLVGDVITLWTLDYSRTGAGFAFIPTVPVMHLEITGTATTPYMIDETVELLASPQIDDPIIDLGSVSRLDHLLDPATLARPRRGSSSEVITLTNFTPSGPGPSIDGARGSFPASVPSFGQVPHIPTSRFARVGDLLELEVFNMTAAHHPFHHHGFSFQPIRMEDGLSNIVRIYDYNEFVDTIDVPGGHKLVYRMRLDDRPMADGVSPGGALGRWLFHCHIFHHAALGMISELVVLKGRERPRSGFRLRGSNRFMRW